MGKLIWPVSPKVPEPELEAPNLFSGMKVPESSILWEYLNPLLSQRLFVRTAVLGSLARVFSGVVSDPKAWVESLRSGKPGAIQQVSSWASEWSAETAHWFARSMMTEIDSLHIRMETLSPTLENAGHGSQAAMLLGREICLEREQLAGMALLLRAWLSEHSWDEIVNGSLRNLDSFDSLAYGHLSELDATGDFDDHPMLDQVACNEPNAWWGSRL